MNLTRSNWKLGWTPYASEKHGNPMGFLRMDNLCLDEDGAVVLANSPTNLEDFGYDIHGIYSNNIYNTKYRFVALSDGTVRYSTGGGFSSLFTGGASDNSAFGSGLGHIIICSGSERKKYDGTTLTDLTPTRPSAAPDILEANKNDFVFYNNNFGNFTVITGDNFVGAASPSFDTTAENGTIEYAGPWDATIYPGTGAQYQVDDTFWLQLKVSNSLNVKTIRIIFNLDATYDPLSNYFSYTWLQEDLVPGDDQWTTLKAIRNKFEKVAVDENKGWHDVSSFRIIIETTAVTTITINENGIMFVGSNESPLNGFYEYMQVNVNNTGSYFARSIRSDKSLFVQLIGGRAQITPNAPTDPQVNEIWIYRRSAEYYKDVQEIGGDILLDQWYRVKVLDSTTGFGQFEDGVSDIDAIQEGNTYEEGCEGISDWTDQVIRGIAGPFNGRFLYMGDKDIYISTYLDPGRYRPLQSLRLSGATTERNLWIRKLNEQTCLVGTSEDIYEITGTLSDLPDGSLDVRVNALGNEHPPIARAVCTDSKQLFYVAADGVRTLGNKVTADLDLLFTNETCHGINPVQIIGQGYGEYGLGIAYGKLWFSAPLTDGSRRTFVFDFAKNYWYNLTDGPNFIFTEEDGMLYASFADGSVKTLNTGSDALAITLTTVFDDNGQPSQRKDTFNFRQYGESIGNIKTELASDYSGGYIQLRDDTLGDNVIDIRSYTLAIRYSFRWTGTVTNFRLFLLDVSYEPRPEQLSWLRIKYTNYGIAAPKRIRTQPLVIDTLGYNVTITPEIDFVAKTPTVVNTNDIDTAYHYYTDDAVGTDWEYELRAQDGGKFELHQWMQPEIIEVLPVPKKFDTVGPTEFNRLGVILGARMRLIVNSSGSDVPITVPIKFYSEEGLIYETSFVVPVNMLGADEVYEIMRVPKTKYGTVCRFTIGPTTPETTFHRYWGEWWVHIEGSQEDTQIRIVR